jgi:hypothetical protein
MGPDFAGLPLHAPRAAAKAELAQALVEHAALDRAFDLALEALHGPVEAIGA